MFRFCIVSRCEKNCFCVSSLHMSTGHFRQITSEISLERGVFILEDKGCQRHFCEVNDNVLEVFVVSDSRTTVQELTKKLVLSKSTVVDHSKQKGQWKTPGSGCHMNWTQSSPVSFFAIKRRNRNVQHKASYIYTTTNAVGVTPSSLALSEIKIATVKVAMTVWLSLSGLIHQSFLNLYETITPEYCQ